MDPLTLKPWRYATAASVSAGYQSHVMAVATVDLRFKPVKELMSELDMPPDEEDITRCAYAAVMEGGPQVWYYHPSAHLLSTID